MTDIHVWISIDQNILSVLSDYKILYFKVYLLI